MQLEVEKAKEKLQEENETQIEMIEDVKRIEVDNRKKKNKKKKSKKNKQNNLNNGNDGDGSGTSNILKQNMHKNKNSTNYEYNMNTKSTNTVFKTIVVFCILLLLNISMLYIITVKHPEIADWLVEFIPPNYRDIIVTKSEDVRLNMIKISNWIHKFRTPPPSMK